MTSQTLSDFARATSVTPTSESTFAADLDGSWKVAGAINGGYLLGVMGRALSETVPDLPDPLVISAYYLGPGDAGPAEVAVRTIRTGRSSATLGAELTQDGRPTMTALATYGSRGGRPGDVATSARPPALPAPEDCMPMADGPREFLDAAPIVSQYDMRLDPATAGFAAGKPSGRGLLQGWIRLGDGADADPLALLAFLDAFPPVMFDLGRFGWSPTMELTAHVRALPAPGWIAVKVETRNIAGGMFEEDCELWDSTGRLVAQSRQLARQPRS